MLLPGRCEKADGKATCQNHGFPNPNNCSRCICPNGFGGDLCDARAPAEGGAPRDCGASVNATGEFQVIL